MHHATIYEQRMIGHRLIAGSRAPQAPQLDRRKTVCENDRRLQGWRWQMMSASLTRLSEQNAVQVCWQRACTTV